MKLARQINQNGLGIAERETHVCKGMASDKENPIFNEQNSLWCRGRLLSKITVDGEAEGKKAPRQRLVADCAALVNAWFHMDPREEKHLHHGSEKRNAVV